jgi:hypothetical protein
MEIILSLGFPDSGDQLLEPLDGAASAHSRVDCISAGTQSRVPRLEIKARVKVECRAILIELRAYSRPIGEDEINLLGPREDRPADRAGRDTSWPLTFDPLKLLDERARLNGHSENDFVLDDEPGHRLLHDCGLPGEEAEQHWQQTDKVGR